MQVSLYLRTLEAGRMSGLITLGYTSSDNRFEFKAEDLPRNSELLKGVDLAVEHTLKVIVTVERACPTCGRAASTGHRSETGAECSDAIHSEPRRPV